MQYRKLGQTNIDVSLICLGTMTWGTQNTEADAHQQLDYAIDHGVNFIDTAEIYAVPSSEETYGITETYIGSWLAKRSKRDELILATKVTGRSDKPEVPGAYIRGGARLNREQIHTAVNESLQRLQTDYIDLYQLHWPERQTNFFGKLGYENHNSDMDGIPIEETLQALAELVKQGKIRYIGLSNETPWGVMQFLSLANSLNLPRIVSIQNPYNLVNRAFEIGLAEFAFREHVGLLAYSPLGFGSLSGKYLHGQQPEGARLTLWQYFSRYTKPQVEEAIEAYVNIANEHKISAAQLALAFVNSRPFITSNIIGATTLAQLEENIASVDVVLNDEIIESIQDVHTRLPNVAP